MHIVDGVLATPVLAAGAAVTIGGIALGLRRIGADDLPKVGVLGATFFVASLIHVPLGPSSVHLILNGLIGLLLGWAAFPALLVALILDAVFFGFGGVTVLGVNAAAIALPGVVCGLLLGRVIARGSASVAAAAGLVVGAGAIALTCLLVAAALAFSGDEFLPAARLLFLAHVPVMVIEGVVTAAAVVLLRKVKPEMLGAPVRPAPSAGAVP